jgi:hypothetical protein
MRLFFGAFSRLFRAFLAPQWSAGATASLEPPAGVLNNEASSQVPDLGGTQALGADGRADPGEDG